MQDSLQLARNANVPTPPVREMAHWNGGRELLLVVIVVYALARGSEAVAADAKSLEREFGPAERTPPQALNLSPSFALPLDFSPPPAQREFSATEFSPHKYPDFGAAPAGVPPAGEARSLSTTTVWQRLADYRSHDRVRLVTLWETTGSTLSIQAGKRGEPSLQWTSRAMNRGGATRGLLDRMISASLGSGGVGQLRNFVRPSQPVASPAKPPSALLPGLAKAP
jgi:hypothetical protein